MIREATNADVEALAGIHAHCFAEAWDMQALKDLLAGPGVFAFLDGEGFILIRVAADEAEILTLCVAEAQRRKGLASALLEAAATRAEKAGAVRMFLEVAAGNTPARNLYEKYGFRSVGHRKAYYVDGSDALVLTAALPLGMRMGNPMKTL